MTEIKTILLADDEPDIRIIAEMSLAQVGGWTTHIASSGAQALELAAKHSPDVILLDVMMPEMDGMATLQALAANEATRNIPVIFMTAKVQSHEKQKYVGLGAIGVIPKPFDPMQLPTNIRQIFNQPVKQRGRNRLAALRQRYAEEIGGKLGGLRSAIEHARGADEGARKGALEAAHTIAHKLHGTAGTYGHPEVSSAIGEVELALERLIAADSEQDWQLIEASLQRAQDSVS